MGLNGIFFKTRAGLAFSVARSILSARPAQQSERAAKAEQSGFAKPEKRLGDRAEVGLPQEFAERREGDFGALGMTRAIGPNASKPLLSAAMIPVLHLSNAAERQRVESLLANLRLDPKQLATRQDEALIAILDANFMPRFLNS